MAHCLLEHANQNPLFEPQTSESPIGLALEVVGAQAIAADAAKHPFLDFIAWASQAKSIASALTSGSGGSNKGGIATWMFSVIAAQCGHLSSGLGDGAAWAARLADPETSIPFASRACRKHQLHEPVADLLEAYLKVVSKEVSALNKILL